MIKISDTIIQSFASKDDMFTTSTPTVDDIWVVATDKQILVVVPIEYTSGNFQKVDGFPDWRAVIPDVDKPLFSVSIPEIYKLYEAIEKQPQYASCKICNGDGFRYNKKVECKRCNGTGHTKKMIGKKIPERTVMSMRGVKFAPDLLNRALSILSHIGATDVSVYCCIPQEALLIKHAGIVILVMQIRENSAFFTEIPIPTSTIQPK